MQKVIEFYSKIGGYATGGMVTIATKNDWWPILQTDDERYNSAVQTLQDKVANMSLLEIDAIKVKLNDKIRHLTFEKERYSLYLSAVPSAAIGVVAALIALNPKGHWIDGNAEPLVICLFVIALIAGNILPSWIKRDGRDMNQASLYLNILEQDRILSSLASGKAIHTSTDESGRQLGP